MKRVLLIEPGFYARVKIDDELSQHGFQVTSVKAVDAALIKMKTQIFHIMLVSFDSMKEDTLRMLLALRESFNYIPVVVLTQRPTEEWLGRILQYRPVEILVTPYALPDLVLRMENMIRARMEEAGR